MMGYIIGQICEQRPELWREVGPLYAHASCESSSAPKRLQLQQMENLLLRLCK